MKNKQDELRKKFEQKNFRFALFVLGFMFVMNFLSFSKHKDFKLFLILLSMILFVSLLLLVIYLVLNKKNRFSKKKPLGVIYNHDMSLNELLILLFHRKRCRNCNSKLKQVKETIFIKEGIQRIGSTELYGKVYNKRIYFKCEKCNKIYSITELAEK